MSEVEDTVIVELRLTLFEVLGIIQLFGTPKLEGTFFPEYYNSNMKELYRSANRLADRKKKELEAKLRGKK